MGNLSILRLLRLLRLTRMARLMRSFPELMVLIKGILAATRSVGATLVLLIIFTYVFAIIFTGQYKGMGDAPGATENDVVLQDYFGSMPLSMFTLIITGTLLDDLSSVVYALLEHSQIMVWVLIIFILLSSFTVLNMLIGILCEVVTATAEGEKFSQSQAAVREVLEDVFDEIDTDRNGTVSEKEFEEMLKNETVVSAFEGLGIEEQHLKALKNCMFVEDNADGSEVEWGFGEFVGRLLEIQPNKSGSVLDVQRLRKTISDQSKALENKIGLAQHQLGTLMQLYSGGKSPQDISVVDLAPTPSPSREPSNVPLSSSKTPDWRSATTEQILTELRKRLPGFGGCLS